MIAAGWIDDDEVKHALLQAAVACGLDHDTCKKRLEDPKGPIGKGMEKPATLGDAPAYTQISVGMEFVERFGVDMRFVSDWKQWMHWDGTHWTKEKTELAFDRVKGLCREIALELKAKGSNSRASAIASAPFVNGAEKLARTERLVAAGPDIWDLNDYLLNTPGGVYDLTTGICSPCLATDYITKITAVAPDPKCPTPLWTKIVLRAMAGNQADVNYLQRLGGYGLIGGNPENLVHFAHGGGANGKTLIIEAIRGCMGNYAKTAMIETFMANRGDRRPTETAALMEARLITAVETEEGRTWNSAKIKELSGNDTVSTRVIGGNPYDVRPRFKPLFYGNKKPKLQSVDEGIKRRLRLIPFTVTIPEKERDSTLGEQLKAEWPGILAWMIQGTGLWLKEGRLTPTKSITDATKDYLEAEDLFAQWLNERCVRVVKPKGTNRRDLFVSCSEFIASMSRGASMNASDFYDALQAAGYPEFKVDGVRTYALELKPRWTEWKEPDQKPRREDQTLFDKEQGDRGAAKGMSGGRSLEDLPVSP